MSEQARYVRVGAFVMGGLALAFVFVLLLGAGSLFERPFVVETVFDESVQGLQIGSPVKLRGVKIGTVSQIGFVSDFYDVSDGKDPIGSGNRVLVRMNIVIEGRPTDREELEASLARQIARGLRLQLSPLGITGTSIIQADYLDPERYPPVEISWKPERLYVPSAPSTITQLSSAADRLMTRINQLDVEHLLTNLDTLLVNVNRVVERANVEGLQRSASALLDDARQTSAELRAAVKQAGVGDLNADARKALGQLNTTLTRLQQVVDGGAEDFASAIENLRVTSENLRDASETARSYPSLVLFGEPPPAKSVQAPEKSR